VLTDDGKGRGVPDDVQRLKQLLFDGEAQGLEALSRRMDVEAAARTEIARRVDAVFERAGTDDRFVKSVAAVLDGALRTAEVERHAELSEAMAPLLSRTVKAEIRNSRDDLVDALYPVTGRMVKAYVASAIKDLIAKVNRRLDANPVMLRLRSLMTGRSVAELALADTQPLEVEELFFIRRGSGELVGHWPQSEDGGRDHLIGGTLTAINEFATEAFKAESAALRNIDLGERQVYVRMSPAYLLAAKCKGAASVAVEQIIDDEFLGTIEEHRRSLDGQGIGAMAAKPADLLPGLMQRLTKRMETAQGSRRTGPSPFVLLLWIFGLPLAAWLAWSLYSSLMTERVRSIANGIIAERADMKGFPTHIDVVDRGAKITVLGLAPTTPTREAILAEMKGALPGTEIEDQMTVMPGGTGNLEPQVAALRKELGSVQAEATNAAARRAIERAGRRLEQLLPDLTRLEKRSKGSVSNTVVGRTTQSVEQTIRELQELRGGLTGPVVDAAKHKALSDGLAAITERLNRAGTDLSTLLAEATVAASGASAKSAKPSDIAEIAEELAAQAERLATITIAALQVNAMRQTAPATPTATTPRQTLQTWARDNAIFFTKESDYRSEDRAGKALDTVAGLIKSAGVLVRVVGYTDERGGSQRNTSLSESRAQKVVAALVERGVPAALLVAVGRNDRLDLSPATGETSPNRRVEFEVAFDGEGGP